MDKYYALFVWKNETGSGGVTIFHDTLQGIADCLIENLTTYIKDEYFYDVDDLERAKRFIDLTNKNQISFNDIACYTFELGIGSEDIQVIGSNSDAIVEIARQLFEVMNFRTLDEAMNDADFDPNNPEGSLVERELICFRLYQKGKVGKFPDQKLIEEIESAYRC